jgi:Homing endonuclease associated repeat
MKPGPRDGFRWTSETIAYAFELWHRKNLCSPTVDEWRRAGPDHPSVTTVRQVFGSWNAAVEAAGLRPRRPGESRKAAPVRLVRSEAQVAVRWSRESTLAAIHAWAESRGRSPSLEQWRRASAMHPSAATVRRLFGSWNAAVEAAGFVARRPGRRAA